LFPAGFLLLMKRDELFFQEGSKIPFNEREISIVFKQVEKIQN
jgi:hypothetical protein